MTPLPSFAVDSEQIFSTLDWGFDFRTTSYQTITIGCQVALTPAALLLVNVLNVSLLPESSQRCMRRGLNSEKSNAASVQDSCLRQQSLTDDRDKGMWSQHIRHGLGHGDGSSLSREKSESSERRPGNSRRTTANDDVEEEEVVVVVFTRELEGGEEVLGPGSSMQYTDTG